MGRVLHIDVETRATADLRKTGAPAYARHPGTDVWCVCYAFDDEPVQAWTPGQPYPSDIAEHVAAGGAIYAHNSSFESVIWEWVLAPRYGWTLPNPGQWHCTAAMAAAMSLPRALGQCAQVLGLDVQKDEEGARVMMRMCRPRKVNADGTTTWWDQPEKVARLIDYCIKDVEVERALTHKLRALDATERKLFLLDAEINNRGVRIDRELVVAARSMAEQAVKILNRRLYDVTGGRVTAATKAADLTRWLREQGILTEGVAKAEVRDLLSRPEVVGSIREAVEIRAEAAKSSNAKLDSMLKAVCEDDRIRGLLLYHGAGTGRWSGKLVQPQNFPRGTVKRADLAIPMIKAGEMELIEVAFGPALDVISANLRGCLIPADGNEFTVADYSNIEGRVIAHLAAETWKTEAFSEFDAGTGPDLYKLAYSKSFGIPVTEVTGDQRQIGKVMELACIAAGQLVLTETGPTPIEQVTLAQRVWDGVDFVEHSGVVCRGFKEVISHDGLTATSDHVVWVEGEPGPVSFGHAAACGLRLLRSSAGGKATRVGGASIPREEVHTRLDGGLCGRQAPSRAWVYDIVNSGPRNRFTVSDCLVHNCGFQGGVGAFQAMAAIYGVSVSDDEADRLKTAWREAHPNVVALWRSLEEAAFKAVQNPGKTIQAKGGIRFLVKGGFLWMVLPSGRPLAYASPGVEEKKTPWGAMKEVVTFWGVNSMTKKWEKSNGFGGLWAENAVQAVARDVMANAMLALEEAGYRIVLTVHDEIICETPVGFGSVKELEEIMCRLPAWATGLPVAAAGWRGPRYRKG